MQNEKMIDLAKDFSPVPAGRFVSDGPFSGQAFRESVLKPQLSSTTLTIVLDGARGLPVSFLEEAFGGLIRQGWSVSDLKEKLKFVARSSQMQRYPDVIWHYISEADKNSRAF